MVVAQLVEWTLPTPEIHSSNPVISNFINYISTALQTVLKRQKRNRGPEWSKFF